ncbi:beta-1,4-glucuronyltransferase 1 [Drosophila busckii]|uniref:beta-1,4-glucuronyltransferase 1 n=1 Tax=Drosophila busckii TaxID=30019 RepID=UPI001432DE9A|nr:beta-1,4-glucuronyltransferase 1 [Drosophila busckii]
MKVLDAKWWMLLMWQLLWLQQLNASEEAEQELRMQLLPLRLGMQCKDRDYDYVSELHGKYWVLQNFLHAEHEPLRCSLSVTYATHAEYSYLDNLEPLVQRWQAPISLAIYAPGEDLLPAAHTPQMRSELQLRTPPTQVNCSAAPTFGQTATLYRKRVKLGYPMNTGRNIAKAAAITHCVSRYVIIVPSLCCPLLHTSSICKLQLLQPARPIVYPLHTFEVAANASVPSTKAQLQQQLANNSAVIFHKHICLHCHAIPRQQEWINASSQSTLIEVFNAANRTYEYNRWEPTYIGTVNDPPYDEHYKWENMYDKLLQVYTLYPPLSYAHDKQRVQASKLAYSKIRRELKYQRISWYGARLGCAI